MSNTEAITTETPVSICIGSDQYAAKVIKVTRCTVTATTLDTGSEPKVFRLNKYGTWKSGHFRLYVGKSETRLDPSF